MPPLALLDNTVLSNFTAIERAELHIPVSGTLGVLLRLVDLKVLTVAEGDALLNRMVALGYHSPVATLEELL